MTVYKNYQRIVTISIIKLSYKKYKKLNKILKKLF